ncbi:potassium voltage-gated channel subfamily H member 1-like [Clytia hemisphaerica]|uniref:Uncharacterized protein n=1 Tax=Clytia hemisphaerica TaxID=252671 RepID=A0A7M5XG68_9CNID
METPQNKFIDNVSELAKEIDANFVLANAALDFYPIIYCSQGFFGDVGWTRNEVTTKDVYLNFMFGRQTGKKPRRLFEKGISKKAFTQVEMILYSKGGTKRWFLVTLMPVKDEHKKTSIFIVFFNYISHLKDPIAESPRRLWKIATRVALKKPSLEYFRRHCDKKKDGEKKRRLDVHTIKAKINYSFIPIYGLTKPQVPRHLIRHSSIGKSIWDWFILLLILYTSVMVPFLIAFETNLDIVHYLDTFVDVMFIFDIVLTFFTTYVENGEIITNAKQIRRHYFRGWFLGDCFGAFPFSFVMYAIDKKEGQVLGILRGLKIIRLIRVAKVRKKIGRYMQMSAVTLGVWLLVFCLCGHWMACVWYLIGTSWDKPGIKKHSWLFILSEIVDQPYNFTAQGDIVEGTGPDLFTVYFSALYYTMSSLTTCGFGNIAPNTAAEKFFGCGSMLLGCVLYALIFGQVTNIISQLQKSSNEFTDQVTTIKNFNKIYKMPPRVAKRFEDYVVSKWAVTKGTDADQIIKPCPRDLQADICMNIHRTVFQNNSAFTHLSEPALRALSRFFYTTRTAPGDKLINTGEEVDTVYFVADGSLEVYSGTELVGLIGPKDSFGKRLTDEDTTKSVYDVKACSYCNIHSVSCDSVADALYLYPEEYDKIKYDLQLAFDITRQLETVTKSGDIISTEELVKEKPELTRDMSRSKVKSSQSLCLGEDGMSDVLTGVEGPGYFATRSHSDVLSGMSELKGELRRETERMNAKMGIVEAQMRLVLKLLRRNNKINDIDPEIGMQLDELMQYDEQEGGEEEDTEWFVADAHGWKEEPPRRDSRLQTKNTGSSSGNSMASVETIPHQQLIQSTSPTDKKASEENKPTQVLPKKTSEISKTQKASTVTTAPSKGFGADLKKKKKPEEQVKSHTVVEVEKDSSQKTSQNMKPAIKKEVSNVRNEAVLPDKGSSSNTKERKAPPIPPRKSLRRGKSKDEDFETINL